MSIWKAAKDKVVIDRLVDEKFHELAFNEIKSGRRRGGLWAKAVVMGAGDETKTKLAYLNILVQHLKDVHYVGQRVKDKQTEYQQARSTANDQAARERTAAQMQAEMAKRTREEQRKARHEQLLSLCALLEKEELDVYDLSQIATGAGASLISRGLFFVEYVYTRNDAVVTFKKEEHLRPFFLKNVVPIIEKMN